MNNPDELKKEQMSMWIDKVLVNLKDIEESIDDIGPKDFFRAREEIIEQYRLIRLMKNVMSGKTRLEGYIIK